MKAYYGAHFWAKPSLVGIARAYGSLFYVGAALGGALAVTLFLAVLISGPRKISISSAIGDEFQERTLILTLLALPVIAFVVARITHGGMTDRYVLFVVVGICLALSQLLLRSSRTTTTLVGTFVLATLGMHEFSFWSSHRHVMSVTKSPTEPVEAILQRSGQLDLPVIVSDGLEYVPLAYYASGSVAKRLTALVDPQQSLAYSGSDSVDNAMLALRCCLPLQVRRFEEFTANNPRFLLYSSDSADNFDWWPSRLVRDGFSLRVLAIEGARKVYLVTAKGDQY
jgi:hypothetical protein